MSRTGAAAPRLLCRLEEIEDGEGRGFTIDGAGEGAGGGESLDIFVVRRGLSVFGYVNSCPHVGTPLDWAPDQFISDDGAYIQCATHGALFEIEDGACIAGPCAGDRLRPVAVAVDGEGQVRLIGA